MGGFVCGLVRMGCRYPSIFVVKVSVVFFNIEVDRGSVLSPESAGSSGNGISDSDVIRR